MLHDRISQHEEYRRYYEEWDRIEDLRQEQFQEDRLKEEKSELLDNIPPDFTYLGYPIYFKCNGNNVLTVIVDEDVKPTDTMISDYNPNKEEKKSIKNGTFFFHRQYKGSYQIEFDRYGRVIKKTEAVDVSISQTNSDVPGDFRTNKNNSLAFSVIDVINAYQKQNGKFPDCIKQPEALPEYFVFKTAKDKLPVTYVFWNGERSREENGLPSTVKTGVFAYYDIDEKDVTESFREVFSSKLTTVEANRRVDLMMPFAKPSNLTGQNSPQQTSSNETTQLTPNSYEEYKWNHGKYDMIENNQIVQKPIKDAIGHYAPQAYTYDQNTKTYNRTNSQYYSGVPAMFPPTKINAQFSSGKYGVPDDIVDGPEYTKDQFLSDIEDILMYMHFYPNVNIHIVGHTSKKGGAANIALSENRARKTKEYIESLQITIGTTIFSLGKNSGRVSSEGVGSRDATGKDANDDSVSDRYIEIIYSVK